MKISYPFAAIPNQIVRGGHGAINVAVFAALLSHGTTTASQQTLAREVGCTIKSIRKALVYWQEHGAANGVFMTTIPRTGFPNVIEIRVCRMETPTQNDLGGRTKTTEVPRTKTTYKEDIGKITKEDHAPSAVGADIAKLFEVFQKSINPTINYGHKTQRQAATYLIDKYGLEKALKMAEYAAGIAGRSFAPVITTPYQLKEKLSQLMIYYKRENDQSNSRVSIVI
jgi:hypothetical protein